MSDTRFKRYLRTNVAEMRPYEPGEDLTNVSVSDVDSPKLGDMIARNPRNHEDQWLVDKDYFEDNFALIEHDDDEPFEDYTKFKTLKI